MSTETSTRPYQVGDRVRITTRRFSAPDEIVDGVVTELQRVHVQSPITMWIKRDVPTTYEDGTPRLINAAYVTDDLAGPNFPLSTQIELLEAAPVDPPTTAPQDHGPLAAPLSDRTLAKVLSRPAYDPPSPTKDAIVEAAIRWYEIRNAHAADVTPLQLFDADDALNMAVKAHHAAVTS